MGMRTGTGGYAGQFFMPSYGNNKVAGVTLMNIADTPDGYTDTAGPQTRAGDPASAPLGVGKNGSKGSGNIFERAENALENAREDFRRNQERIRGITDEARENDPLVRAGRAVRDEAEAAGDVLQGLREWGDGQRIMFALLGLLFIGIGGAALLAPRLGFGSFREEWLRSSGITTGRAIRNGGSLLAGAGKGEGDGAGPDHSGDPRPDFGGPIISNPRVSAAAAKAGKAAPKPRNPFASNPTLKVDFPAEEPFSGSEPRAIFEDGGKGTRAGPLKGNRPNKKPPTKH